jgi:hypothetical protein
MSKYTDLITNYHATKPLFFQHVDLSTRPLLDTSTTLNRLVTAFDIDTRWRAARHSGGMDRTQPLCCRSHIRHFLRWDTDGLGYDQGVWQGHMTLTVGIPR